MLSSFITNQRLKTSLVGKPKCILRIKNKKKYDLKVELSVFSCYDFYNDIELITFYYPYKVEKALFWGQIFGMEILMDLHVLRASESENHIFSGSSVCMCVCVSTNSINQKQITTESSNLEFYICIISRCYLKHFMKIGQKFCVQGHTKEL